MRNKIYDGDIYNKDIKTRFLNEYEAETSSVYQRIFIRSYPLEEQLGRDLYDFNIKELSNLFFHLNPTTEAASKTNISLVSNYLDWAIQNGYRTTSINPIHYQLPDWANKFVDSSIVLYYSKDQIDEVIEKCVNPQDAVIISLLFEGVSGTELSEIRNLRPRDVNYENNTLNLTDEEGNQRTITVSDTCIRLIKEAIAQTEYLKRNGEISPNSKNTNPAAKLLETGYVIKPAKTRVVHTEQVNQHLIYQRLRYLAECFEMEHLKKYNSIKRSGMIYMGKVLYEKYGVLEKEQYIQICEHFGVSKIQIGNNLEYNWWGLKSFVNLEMIEKLYGKEAVH
jgi:integrase